MKTNTASHIIANQICNMLYNNVISLNGTEPFEGWCEDGAIFEEDVTNGADEEELIDLMKQIAPAVDEISYILEQKMCEEYDIEATGITRAEWFKGLNQFYYDCVNNWTNEGLTEDDAIKLAIRDCLSITHWPYSPKGPRIPESIADKWRTDLQKEDFYLLPISIEGANKMREKYKSEYWKNYKALGE